MKYLFRLVCALALGLALAPASIFAQDGDWRELRTNRFAILYVDSDAQTAQQYAGFVDSIYDETAAIFGHHTATPITLRLYPSLEKYYEVNPLARGLTGIVAHADYRRHEVVVIIPQTARQNDVEIQNNVRHELTHIVASDLSDDRLNVMLQEGLAQYLEHAAPELETRILLLKSAFETDRLVRWSDLDDRDRFYSASEVSYPQSLSIVAFLVERFSFAKLRDLLTAAGQSSGYRSAIERTYGVAPDKLEEEWRSWLPGYLDGGYKRNAITAYDLSRAQELLNQGNYAEARSELEAAIDWLRTTDQAEVLQQAQALLERSEAGQRAEALATDARAALEAADYARAAGLTAQARQAYADLGDARQDAVLAEYAARAERGLQADQILGEATQLADTMRYPQARASADRAVAEFIALGDSVRAEQARALRAAMDQRQSLLGALLLALGAGGIAASIWRRLTVREVEAW